MPVNYRKAAQDRPCQVAGCGARHFGRGYCRKHYTRWLRTGDAETRPYSCRSDSARSRFMESVEMVPEAGCWIWMKGIGTNGYGKASHNGRTISAHRLSYVLFVGSIPKRAHVLHSCDVRCCVNPSHLRAGTHKENMQDALRKFRLGKLSKAEVENIRKAPGTVRDIGERFGISNAQVSAIKRGISWPQ